MKWNGLLAILLAIASALTACASPQAGPVEEGGAATPRLQPKRIVAALRGVPLSLYDPLTSSGGGQQPGSAEMSGLANLGLTVEDNAGERRPMLAEQTPSVENGLWRVFPDGRMETIWRIRENVRWHDGTPATAADVEFTARLEQDAEMPWRIDAAYRFVESVRATDARTVTVTWKEPYIRADQIMLAVLPRHLLASSYEQDKGALLQLPYWNTEFVGTGAFKLKQWDHDLRAVLVANEHFVFGRPKVDEIEVRFVPDVQAMLANLLAGTVELTLGNNASLEQALQVKDQWEQQGRLRTGSSGWQNLNPQFLNPNPAILLDPQFRRALYHAIDRKTMAEQLSYGYSEPADSSIHPGFAEYRYIEPQIVRYAYDPRRASQMIEDLGYRKGSDGMFRDSAGQSLSIQIMATGDDTNSKPTFAVLDYFRAIGVTPDPEIVPNQRARDLEYRANFRSFALQGGQGFGPDGVRALLSTDARTAERNYVGGNYVRYMNPQVDALVERYFTTIAFNGRMEVLGQLVRHTTENLIWMPLYWRVVPTFIHHRLREVPAAGDVGVQQWNAHLWDVE